jgi:hypothetical protein
MIVSSNQTPARVELSVIYSGKRDCKVVMVRFETHDSSPTNQAANLCSLPNGLDLVRTLYTDRLQA